MCDPLSMTIASIGVSMAGAAAQYVGQQQQASKEADAINQSVINQYTQGQEHLVWNDVAAQQKLAANARAARQAQGKLTAAASSMGINGLTIGALSNEVNANAGHYASDVEYNRTAADEKIQTQLKGIQDDAQSRLNQIQQPSLFNTVLGVGTDALDTYNRFNPPKELMIPTVDDLNYQRSGIE